jgi:hypothetical protein
MHKLSLQFRRRVICPPPTGMQLCRATTYAHKAHRRKEPTPPAETQLIIGGSFTVVLVTFLDIPPAFATFLALPIFRSTPYPSHGFLQRTHLLHTQRHTNQLRGLSRMQYGYYTRLSMLRHQSSRRRRYRCRGRRVRIERAVSEFRTIRRHK